MSLDDPRIPSRAPIDNIRTAVFTPMAVRAALQLGVFTPLVDGPMTSGELADALGVKPGRLEALLYQLVLAEFLSVSDGRFTNTEMSGYYLVEGKPNYAGGIHGIWTENFNALMQTAETIRSDTAQNKVDFSAMSQDELGSFIRGLHGASVAVGRSLSKQPQFAEAQSLVDVGGGSGGLAIALCEERPQLRATVLELPSVVPIAAEMVEKAGLADRISVASIDIVNAPLDGEYDVATARALFQVLSAEQCGKVAKNIGAGVSHGGTMFVLGLAADDSHLAPVDAVGMNLVFAGMFDGGQAYTESEYRHWLSDAGFGDISWEQLQGGYSLITGSKT